MAIHSSILAWRMLWTEKPGGLHSMGSQRVGHDWATHTTTFDSYGFIAESVVKNLHAMQETRAWSLSQEGRAPEKGNGNWLQCSCLENPMDRGAWWVSLSDWTCSFDSHSNASKIDFNCPTSTVMKWRPRHSSDTGQSHKGETWTQNQSTLSSCPSSTRRFFSFRGLFKILWTC